ncbi:hypothetical protein [uncultured Lacinutrix sp.]|uniref:hypothetical protein n=1 Tax=uncultured Lacinutrix sp. TaxID=574032 RepID=UPI00260E9CB0|nr:hypothetical protein [uncultured Lacinutrix sp.]
MKKYLSDPRYNIIAIFIAEIIGIAFTFTADFTGAGLESVIIKWAPAIIGIIALFSYLISRLFLKQYNWIISLIGILIILIVAIHIHNTDFTQTI